MDFIVILFVFFWPRSSYFPIIKHCGTVSNELFIYVWADGCNWISDGGKSCAPINMLVRVKCCERSLADNDEHLVTSVHSEKERN